MHAFPFDGSSRVVVIIAGSSTAPSLCEQRAELLKHVAALKERDIVVFAVLPSGVIEPVHGPGPTPSGVESFLRRNASSELRADGHFVVLLVGKDGGVKFRSEEPVRAQDLFALIDAMPMRRQEMKR